MSRRIPRPWSTAKPSRTTPAEVIGCGVLGDGGPTMALGTVPLRSAAVSMRSVPKGPGTFFGVPGRRSAPACWPTRHGGVRGHPSFQPAQPRALRRRAGRQQGQGERAMDQQLTQADVAALADPEQARLAAHDRLARPKAIRPVRAKRRRTFRGPSLDPRQVRDLAACRWVANGLDLIKDSVGSAVRKRSVGLLRPVGRLVAVGNASGEVDDPAPSRSLWLGNAGVLGSNLRGCSRLAPERDNLAPKRQ